ncbi:MAG: Hsp20 family protein [Alphaproteobacteria bacterium GM7ARS4]|nr:Hsp20 family protein [Alphaproteobacteria bacterium GM7ARS4]
MNSFFNHPLMLGFDHLESMLEDFTHRYPMGGSGVGYPPFNIERVKTDDKDDAFRITLAVAGFSPENVKVWVHDNQLHVEGNHHDMVSSDDATDTEENTSCAFIHKGIANRAFKRVFALAEGMEVRDASMREGLLSIDVVRPSLEKRAQHIAVRHGEAPTLIATKGDKTAQKVDA